MSKLLHANFARIRKQKIFWAELILLAIYSAWLMVNTYWTALEYDQPFNTAFARSLFTSFILEGILLAIFCSLFIGTEYSDGTIRNKLVVGQPRAGIYLANFTSCTITAWIQSAIALAVIWAVGLPLMGTPQIAPAEYFQTYGSLLCLCMAYAAIYNLVAMLSNSKAHTAVINILLAFVFLFIAIYLYQMLTEPEMINQFVMTDGDTAMETVPNPNYLTGMKRTVYQFLFDFTPGGQSVQVAEFTHGSVLMCVYSLIITVLLNFAGILLFKRKDIK